MLPQPAHHFQDPTTGSLFCCSRGIVKLFSELPPAARLLCRLLLWLADVGLPDFWATVAGLCFGDWFGLRGSGAASRAEGCAAIVIGAVASLFSGVAGAAAGLTAGLLAETAGSGRSALGAFGRCFVSFAAVAGVLVGAAAVERLMGCADFAVLEGTGTTLPIWVPADPELLLLGVAGVSCTGFWAL